MSKGITDKRNTASISALRVQVVCLIVTAPLTGLLFWYWYDRMYQKVYARAFSC